MLGRSAYRDPGSGQRALDITCNPNGQPGRWRHRPVVFKLLCILFRRRYCRHHDAGKRQRTAAMSPAPRKLSQKLILSLTVLLIMFVTVASIVHVKTQQGQLLNVMVLAADQLSGSIVSATWHAMLTDQRQGAYEIMNTIALKQGINRIRIFNREGRVMFSTTPGDVRQVDRDAKVCLVCHSSLEPRVKVDVVSRSRIYKSDGGRKLAMVTPIYNEPSCSNADCHAHPSSMKVLGVLDVSFDLAQIDKEVSWIWWRVGIITGTMVLLMSAFTFYFTRHFVSDPIRQLIRAARSVSAMQLDSPITIDSSEELGELAVSFDTMRLRLKEAQEENQRIMQSLETKVQERTEQLRIAHRKLLHTDRLASLGQLSASVAHEINNPLSGVLNLAMIMQRLVKEQGIPPDRIEEFKKYLSQVIGETTRVGRIVQDLLAFSRRSKPQRTKASLASIITATVNLLSHKLKLMNVAVELALDSSIPPIQCDASQIQQVLINLIMNGAESAQNRKDGKVVVRTLLNGTAHTVVLQVSDNGDGIQEENIPKIFDPFFTTKGEGKGVGLGLAVVYGIIESHKGEIEVQSKVGEGTTFSMRLPMDTDAGLEAAPSSETGNAA